MENVVKFLRFTTEATTDFEWNTTYPGHQCLVGEDNKINWKFYEKLITSSVTVLSQPWRKTQRCKS